MQPWDFGVEVGIVCSQLRYLERYKEWRHTSLQEEPGGYNFERMDILWLLFWQRSSFLYKYIRNPLTRTLIVRIANYPDPLGPSVKHFLPVLALHLSMG
jgi:hypothetical protein